MSRYDLSRSPLPLYYQLKQLIVEKIENEELSPGDCIPSERELSEQYRISRMTVRQAITELVHEGVLYRRQGKGTFVAEPKIEQGLVGLTSFTEDMISRGMEPATTLISKSVTNATRRIAKLLELRVDQRIGVITRLRFADGEPMALETCHLPHGVYREIENQDLTGSLYSIIEDRIGPLGKARQTLEPVLADATEASFLRVEPGAPLLMLERITFLRDGRPVELARSVYRGDRYKFCVELKRQNTN